MSVADKLKKITVPDYDYAIRQERRRQYTEEARQEAIEKSRQQEQAAANTQHAQHSRETYLAGMQQRAARMSDEELDAEINRLQAGRPQGSEKSSGINRFFGSILTGTGNNKGAADLYGKAQRDEENKIKQGAFRSTLSPLLREKDRRQSVERQSAYKTMTAQQLRSAYENSTDGTEKSEIYAAMGDKLLDRLSPRQLKILDNYRNADYAVKSANAGGFAGAFTGGVNYNYKAQSELQKAKQAVIAEFGEAWADVYTDIYDRKLNASEAEERNTRAAQLADRHPVIGTAASAATSFYKPAALAEAAEAFLERRPIDYNSPYFAAQGFSGAVTDTVKNKVDWNVTLPGYGETDMFDFLYDTGMSMVDSIAAGTLMGPAGGAFIGLEAAADTMYDAAQKGLDVKDAVVQGVLAGIFEGLFETVSLSQFKGLQEQGIKNLFSREGVKQFFRNIGVSTLTNASEETFTEIANVLADVAINGGVSDYGEAAEEYMMDGYTEKEARKKAAGDMALQVIAAGAGGALMGGVMGGMGSALGANAYRTQQRYADRVRGAQLASSGKAEAVAQRADSSRLKEKVLAEATARREAAAQAKSAADVAQAAGAAVQADEEKNRNRPKMRDSRFLEGVGELDAQIKNKEVELATVKRLQQLGEAGDTAALTKTARAIINTVEGAAYNADEKTIRNSRYGNKVLNELKTAAQGKTYLDNEWAYKLSDKLNTIYEGTDTNVGTTSEDSDKAKNDGGQKAAAAEIKTEAVKAPGRAAGTAVTDSTDEYTVRTADREYNAEELAKLPEAQREVVLAAGAYSPEGASVFIENKPENINTRVYNANFNTMYTSGRLGISYDEAAKKNHYSAELLGEDVARAAFNAGRNEVRAAQRTAAPAGGVRTEGRYENATEKKSRIDAVYSAIAAKTGLDIQRVEELTDGRRTANGEYIVGAARIIMSEGARNETGDVVHELGHFAADFAGEKYRAAAGAIVRYNLSRYGQESIDSEIRGVMKDYGTDYAAAKEEYINECLAGLFSTDDGMQQFVDWLNGDSGYSEKEKKGILQKLREMLDKVIDILKEVLHRENMSDIAKKQAETELEKAKEMRALLLEALDEAGAKVKGTGEAKAETGEKKGSFFGKKAKTANIQKLSEAEKLEKDGADSETIRKATGWFRGLENKWRFEVSDLDSRLIENPKLERHWDLGDTYYTGKLSDILDHRELFKAYPQLKDINIIIQQTQPGVQGSYFPRANDIVMSVELFKRTTKEYNDYLNGGRKAEIASIEQTDEYKEYAKFFDEDSDKGDPVKWLEEEKKAEEKFFSSEIGKRYYQLMWGKVDIKKFEPGWSKEAKNVLMHEIQHAVQYIENFAKGGNPKRWESRIKAGYDTRTADVQREEKRLLQQLEEIKEAEPELYGDVRELERIKPNVPRGRIDFDTLTRIEEDPAEWKAFDRKRNEIEKLHGADKVSSLMNLLSELNRLENKGKRTAGDLYYATAGEIEARDVQKRLDYTDEQRKEKRPDIDRTDAVFSEGEGESYDTRYSTFGEDSGGGNGYDGYSMSNNARTAYSNGEMPLSKWTKAEMLARVREYNEELADKLASVKTDVLKEKLLTYSSWHHTSKMYNETNFYEIRESTIEDITDKKIEEWKNRVTGKPEAKTYRGDFTYIEWVGNGRHKRAKTVELTDVNIEERGSFYVVTNDNGIQLVRKKIGSNGTNAVDYVAKAEAEKARAEAERQRIKREEEYKINSSKEAYEYYAGLKFKERSRSGYIYEAGRKPTSWEYDYGLDKFFKVGEHRIYEDVENTRYVLETWDGKEWIPEQLSNGEKFSLQPVEDENELLKKENRRLEEIENTLRGQYDSRKEISAAGLEASAREIYRQVKSSVSVEEITNRLKKIQDDAREKDYSFEDFNAACRDLADELVDTSKRKTKPTTDAQEILKEIRATGIKFSELQKEEAGYAADGRYLDYFRRTFGKISIRKDGVPLETQWHIWHEQFPKWFPASTTEAEMPGRLLNNITALYDSYDNEYGMYAEDDKKFTAAEIMNVFSNADGVNYAIAELREQRLEQVRRISGSDENQTAAFVSAQIHSKASRNEAYIRAKKRKEITSKVKKLNRQFSSGTDTDHIPEEMREAVGSLIAAFTGNNDILSEDAVKILYNAYGVAFEDVENMGDESESGSLTGYSQEIREAIQQLYSIAKKQGELKLSKLTTEELTTVEKVVGNISYIVENRNAVFLDEKQQALEEVGHEHLKDLEAMKKRKYITIGDMQFSPVKDKTVIPNLKPVYFFEMMTTKPMQLTFKDMMLGQNRLAQNSKAAKEYLTQMSKKYEAYKWADTELEPIRTSEGRTLKLTVEQALNIYATAKRERRNIGTPGETRHLKNGGVIFEKQLEGKDKKVRLTSLDTNAYHLDVFDISVIEQALSEQQKEYADSMVQYLSTDMAELGNDTSMKLYGYKKYTEGYYFPFSSDRHYSEQKLGVANDRKLKSSGFTKKLTRQASTPLVLRDFTDVWSSHVEDMCEYNAFAIPLDTLNRIFNYKQRPASLTSMRRDSYMILKEQFGQERAQELSKAAARIAMNEAAENDPELAIYASSEGVIRKELSGMDKEEAKAVKAAAHSVMINGSGDNISASQLYEDAYGKRAAQWLSTFVKDVNGNVIKDSRESDFGSRLVSNAKKAAVLGNASVTVQQFSAVARALPYVGIKYFAKTTVSGRGNKTWEECQKYCGVAIIKDIGGFDTGTGHSVARWIADGRDDIKGAKKKIRDKAENALSFGAEEADKITWCHIWNACKNKAENKGFAGEEMFLKAAEYFNEVIEHTQVYDSVLSRSDSMRSKSGFMQMLTAFMSEPTVTFNMIVDAMTDVKAHNTKRAAAIGVSLVCNIVLNTMLKNIVKALRDDDEDEAYLEKYISGVIGDLTGEMQIINGHRVYTPMSYLTSEFSIASMLPYIKDIVSILQGYGVDRMDLSAVSDVFSATTNLVKAFESNDSEKLGKAAYSFVLAGSSLTGIPAGNLARYAKAVINATHMRGLLPEADALIKQIQDGTGTGAYDTNRKIKYLYNAYAQKNDKKKATAESFYDDPKKIEADLKKGLREYDGRISKAAEQFVDGNVDGYMNTAREIINEKTFDEDMIIEAIQAEITQVKKERGITDSEDTSVDRMNALFKAEDYYFAVQDGKTQNAEKIKDEIINTAKVNGKTEDEAKQYFRGGVISAIKKNDERIEKAAKAWLDGNFKEYKSLVEQIAGEGKFDRNYIEKAAKNAVNEIKEDDPYTYIEKDVSLFDTDDFVRAAYDGSEDMLTDIKAEITGTEIANGKSEDDAEDKFKTNLRASLKAAYQEGDASPELVTRLLGEYDEQTEEDAANTMTVWDIQKEYPGTALEAGSIKSYVNNNLADYGIDIPTYEEYHEGHKKCKGIDSDGDGKADNGTKQAQIIDVIDALPISSEQKRALFLLDYSAKNCPW